MMQRRSQPVPYKIRTVTDVADAGMTMAGSMQALTNLIPDPSTMGVWQCRPASFKILDFALSGGAFNLDFNNDFQIGMFGFTTGVVSTMKISGSLVYGMVAALGGSNAGFDVPFCFNLATNAGIPVTGTQTPTTLPATPATTGPWTPPQMDIVGTKIMIAHAGYSGAGGNFVGWFDLTNPLLPVYNAGNLTGGVLSFTQAPTSVRQFFGRAYYIHNTSGSPAVIFSDPLAATNVTFASQVLTFGDNTPLTALGALPLYNMFGGIVQSLMVFKGVSNVFQVTGDQALNNLYLNSLNMATGTLAQNSICTTPKGLAFMSPDGFRIIDFSGQISDVIGLQGTGVTVPFIYAAQPTRVFASCNGNLMRVSTQNAKVSGSPNQDWWYDWGKSLWSGPHTFPAAIAQPYQQTFIIAPIGVNGLWQSDFVQYLTSTFTENGNAMSYTATSSLLPDLDRMTNNCITEGSVDLALPTNASASFSFSDQSGVVIDSVVLVSTATIAPATWGVSKWGQFKWGGTSVAPLAPYRLSWHIPVTFARGFCTIQGLCSSGLQISTVHLRIQSLRSMVNTGLAA